MSPFRWAPFLCGILWQAAGASEPKYREDYFSLLQANHRRVQRRRGDNGPAQEQHYWPHPRGRVGQYSQTPYGIPLEQLGKVNLSDALAWKWVHPTNLSGFVWGTLIDKDKNVVIIAMQGVFKYTADGEKLWAREDITSSQMSVIMGSALYLMQMGSAKMQALDLSTGRTLWSRKEAETTGMQGDMVEGHNGVLVAAVGLAEKPQPWGAASKRAIGVNASTGEQLWSYTPECGIWNIMSLFPDEDTLNFMDDCGGLYRLGLYNGSELWKHSGSPGSMTDGGATLGPDDSIYTCSNGPNSRLTMNNAGTNPGRVRKYRQADGALLWETVLPSPCMNFPSATPDGESVVLAEGGNVIEAPTKNLIGKHWPRQKIDDFYAFQQELLRNKSQLAYYGRDPLTASISIFDAHTGKTRQRHDVEPWYGMGFALDEERAYNFVLGKSTLPHCGPPHWGGATIDQEGTIYIGRSSGDLHIYNPKTEQEITWPTGDGAMMGGVAFAPGLMVVPTCSWVYVFKI